MTDFSLNERAWALADRMVADADELGVVTHDVGGARVVDAGVKAAGGLGAGLAMARICMGGLGNVSLTTVAIEGESWAGVDVWTDHPAISCMASQYAGWTINPSGYFAMGSGPLRAKARVERALFDRLGYAEPASRGVLVLESAKLPTPDAVAWIASQSRIAVDALTLVVARTASLAGGVQIVARVVETALHKLDTLGFDVKRVLSASGTAPLPPVAGDDIGAIGRTNDCVLYGGQTRLHVDASDEELAAIVERLPSSASHDYGTRFADIFARYDRGFYRIDPMLFSPAEVWLTSSTSGRTFHAGRVNAAVLRASLFGG